MRIVTAVAAATLGALAALPVHATTVGQPLLVIDAADGGNPTGSLLDFFGPFGPSGQLDASLSGTITEAFGAPSTVGLDFALSTSIVLDTASLTLGETVIDGFDIFAATSFDPLQEGPGDLNFALFVLPPFTEVPPFDPFGTFVYGGDFAEFPSRDGDVVDFPEFELRVSVFLDGPLPTREFVDEGFDPPETFTFVEGPLSISRIEIGTVGGAPLPPVPLPAGLPLLLGALGAVALVRRRGG